MKYFRLSHRVFFVGTALGFSGMASKAAPLAKTLPSPTKSATNPAPSRAITAQCTPAALAKAIQAGDLARVKFLVENGPKSLVNAGEYPPLQQTTDQDRADIALYLIQHGARWDTPVDGKTESGATALHYAVLHKAFKVAGVLLSHGADINATRDKDMTPLQTAMQQVNVDFGKWLLDKGADPDARDYNKRTALFYAVSAGDVGVAMANLLVSRGATIDASDGQGQTALFYASQQDAPAMTTWLLGKGASANTRNDDDQTPLEGAIAAKRFKAAKVLAKSGAILSRKNKDGSYPFDLALNQYQEAELTPQEKAAFYELCEALFDKSASRDLYSDLTPIASKAQKAGDARFVELLVKKGGDSALADNIVIRFATAAAGDGTLTWKAALDAALLLEKKTDPDARANAMTYWRTAAEKLPPTGFDAEAEGIYAHLTNAPSLTDAERTQFLDAFIKRLPQSANARALRARSRSDAGDYLRSVDDWNTALKAEVAPDLKAEWLFQRGYVFTKLEKWPLAIADFDAAEKMGATKADLWNNRGFARATQKDYAAAMTDYQTALQKDPNLFEAQLNIGNALRTQGKNDEALTAYQNTVTQIQRTALTASFTNAEHDRQLGQAYSKTGEILSLIRRDSEAIAAFSQALVYRQSETDLTNRADLYNYNKRSADALVDAEAAIALAPQQGAPYYEKGLALTLLDRRDEALTALTQGIAVAPGEGQLYFLRSKLYEAKGMSREAQNDIDKARQLNGK